MILVTGAAGMTGSFVVNELLRRGQEVRAFVRSFGAALPRSRVDLAVGDLTEPDSLRRAARGTDGILHLACASMHGGDPCVDVAATTALLDSWERGAFVFVSSVDVYGIPRSQPVTEDHPLDDSFEPYGWGKIRCEELLQARARARGSDAFTVLRPPHIWGPHPRCHDRFVSRLVRGRRPIVLPGRDESEWSRFGDDWVDARDLAWVAAECLVRPLGGAANVISGHFIWHEVFAEWIRLRQDDNYIEHREISRISGEDREHAWFFAQSWSYSSQKLEERLGFRSSRRWQDTLAEVAAAAPPPLEKSAP